MPLDDESDLVAPDDSRYESRAWLVIGPGYHPLKEEYEEPPKANWKDREPGATAAQMIEVRVKGKGRTGKRPRLVYTSLNEAIRNHGRAVRSSLGTGKISGTVKALRVFAQPRVVDNRKHETSPESDS